LIEALSLTRGPLGPRGNWRPFSLFTPTLPQAAVSLERAARAHR